MRVNDPNVNSRESFPGGQSRVSCSVEIVLCSIINAKLTGGGGCISVGAPCFRSSIMSEPSRTAAMHCVIRFTDVHAGLLWGRRTRRARFSAGIGGTAQFENQSLSSLSDCASHCIAAEQVHHISAQVGALHAFCFTSSACWCTVDCI